MEYNRDGDLFIFSLSGPNWARPVLAEASISHRAGRNPAKKVFQAKRVTSEEVLSAAFAALNAELKMWRKGSERFEVRCLPSSLTLWLREHKNEIQVPILSKHEKALVLIVCNSMKVFE